ncbi:hypothetical protein JVU11DRAFT_4574 [Chiua virens]|nr:hypothetical protein JVU11DRAFT_4574 [Chiua virens]
MGSRKFNADGTFTCNIAQQTLWTSSFQPYYVKSTHSLLMTSSASRSQASNVDDVLAKLHTLVAGSAKSLITRSPTEEQKERVVRFQKADDAHRRIQKDKRSAAKKSRSNKHWD